MTEEPSRADQDLATRAQAGDRHAFEQLVLRHKAALYRFVRRYVGDGDEAYDILQDALISAWLALRRFDAQQSFAGWLRAIALNKCRDHGRRRAVRRRLLALFGPERSHAPNAEEWVLRAEEQTHELARLRRLDQAIAQLPRLYKEPLLLITVSGLSQQEVAAQLRISPKAVEMRVRRARKRLIAVLGDTQLTGGVNA